MPEPKTIINELEDLLEKDPELRPKLERSIRLARQQAKESLNEDLYAALDWPTELATYEEYLQNSFGGFHSRATWRRGKPLRRRVTTLRRSVTDLPLLLLDRPER